MVIYIYDNNKLMSIADDNKKKNFSCQDFQVEDTADTNAVTVGNHYSFPYEEGDENLTGRERLEKYLAKIYPDGVYSYDVMIR